MTMNNSEIAKSDQLMNRRSFLAGSSLIVGGLVTCNLPAEKYAFVNPPDKKKFGTAVFWAGRLSSKPGKGA